MWWYVRIIQGVTHTIETHRTWRVVSSGLYFFQTSFYSQLCPRKLAQGLTCWDQPNETLLPQGWGLNQRGKSFSFHRNERGRDRAGLENQVVTQLAASVGVVSCKSPSSALHPNPPSAVGRRWQDVQPACLAEAMLQDKLAGEWQQGHGCPPPVPAACCPQRRACSAQAWN